MRCAQPHGLIAQLFIPNPPFLQTLAQSAFKFPKCSRDKKQLKKQSTNHDSTVPVSKLSSQCKNTYRCDVIYLTFHQRIFTCRMSSIRDFFQNLFGGGGNNEHKTPRFDDYQPPNNGFRNPIWQNNDDNDDEYGDDYRRSLHPRQDMPFQIFSNPFGIMRYFESQMDSMLEDMMRFGRDGVTIEEFNDPNIQAILPPPQTEKRSSLRDQFLKSNRIPSSFDDVESSPRVDMDLDGKVTADDVSKVWKESIADNTNQLVPRSGSDLSRNSKTYEFPTSRFSMEQRSTVTDSNGKTKTTIKRQVGDKLHTIITERNRDGVETRTESFTDVDQQNFGLNPRIGMGTFGSILWDEFFNPNPKL